MTKYFSFDSQFSTQFMNRLRQRKEATKTAVEKSLCHSENASFLFGFMLNQKYALSSIYFKAGFYFLRNFRSWPSTL